MGISSATSTPVATSNTPVSVGVQKKAQDVQAQQVLKILESSAQQMQQTTSQKTGIGSNLNLSA
ncbi:hypothetical protein JHD47_03700 [Sulfurimonas sp. SAG-AH-194-L11]|nr:hypothetical protein [Sulfurimonas sp. SAG-AH-194-L11]MDF1876916.1 hypothetical protein [Sulfurimonas sp. SAG-AH-194-L11]